MWRPLTIAGLAIAAAAGWLALRSVRFGDFADALADAELWPWMPLAVGSYALGHVVRGMRCRLLVRPDARISIAEATGVVLTGYAANNVLPARLGELVRAAALCERTGIPWLQALGVTFFERVLDGLVLLALLAVGAATSQAVGWQIPPWRAAAALLGIAAALAAMAVILPGTCLSIAARAGRLIGPSARDLAIRAVTSLTSAAAYLRGVRRAAVIGVLSLAVWLCEAGLFVFLLPAVGLPISISAGLLALTVTNLGILLPSSPGFIGTFHFFCMQAIMATGAAPDVALSYAVLTHAAFFVPTTIVGGVFAAVRGVSFTQRVNVARSALPLDVVADPAATVAAYHRFVTPQQTSSRLMRSVVDSLVTRPPAADASAHASAVDFATGFTVDQIAMLPWRLRAMQRFGLWCFNVVTLVAFLRPFTALDLDRRRRWIGRWAYGRVALARKLFRAIRSVACLAYYEVISPFPSEDAR